MSDAATLNAGTREAIEIDRSKGDFHYPESLKFDAGTGLSKATVDYISDVKGDPDWIREYRHRALEVFESKPIPTHWASKDLDTIDFDVIRYYLSDGVRPTRSWDEVPDDVKMTFERLGIPEQERAYLAELSRQLGLAPDLVEQLERQVQAQA